MPNSPQVKDGYLVIASGRAENDILSALAATQLTGVEFQIVLLIIRKTYGYNKKEDWVSLSQFVKVTGRTKQGVLNAIAGLEARCVIHVRREVQKTFYGFNKNFTGWKIVHSTLPVKKSRPVNSRLIDQSTPVSSVVNESGHTKDNYTKDNLTKDSGAKNAPTPSQQAVLFFTDETVQQKAIEFFTSKGAGAEEVRRELTKFISYWTEPNKSGTKVRWQLQSTFDVKRRLVTWLNNAVKYDRSGSFSTPEI